MTTLSPFPAAPFKPAPLSPVSRKRQILGGKEQRRRPRVTIRELNERGVQAVQEKWPDLREAGPKLQEAAPDPRSAITKVFDWIDLPRNLIANAIGAVAGVPTGKLPKAALGVRRVMMSDVLRHLGVKNRAAAAIAGFIGDLAIDPLMYLSAGARTGTFLAKWLPRLKPGAMATLKAVSRGRPIRDRLLIWALGGPTAVARFQRVAGLPGGPARLLRRRGGDLLEAIKRLATRDATRAGNAARAWLKANSYAGRQLFRVPFTRISGPTLGVGRQARAWKSLKLAPGMRRQMAKLQAARQIERIGDALQAARVAQRAAVKARNAPAAAHYARRVASLRTRAARVLASAGLPAPAAMSGMALKRMGRRLWITGRAHKVEAPAILRAWTEAEFPTYEGRFRRRIREMFGHRPTPLRQEELRYQTQRQVGSWVAYQRMFDKVAKRVDNAAEVLVKRGYGRGDPKRVRTLIGHILDIGGQKNLRNLHPQSYLAQNWFRARNALVSMEKEPEVHRLLQFAKAQMQRWVRQARAAGIRISPIEEMGYFPRTLTKKAAQLTAEMSRRAPGARARLATLTEPALRPRTRWLEYTHPTMTGPDKVRLVLSSDPSARTAAEKAGFILTRQLTAPGGAQWTQRGLQPPAVAAYKGMGYKVAEETWPITLLEWNRMARAGKLQTILSDRVKAGRLKALFETDPARAIAARARQQERMLGAAGILKLAARDGAPIQRGDIARLASAGLATTNPLPAGHPFAGTMMQRLYTSPTGPRVMAFPQPVADMLNRLRETYDPGRGLEALLKATDMTLGWFKRWALYHPAYVIRNAFQNCFGMLMAGGKPSEQVRWAISDPVGKIFRAVERGQISGLRGFVTLRGQRVPLQLLAERALMWNFHMAGRSTAEFTHEIMRGAGALRGAARMAGRRGMGIAEFVRQKNAALETRMRLGAWLAFIDEGRTPRDAMLKTLQAMPDLSDITRFERSFMTRIWPWYRWFHGNGALQLLHYIPNEPAWMASVQKLKYLMEGVSHIWRGEGDVPEELRPQWMREQQAAQILGSSTDGSVFLLRNWFPFEEVQSIVQGGFDVGEFNRYVMGQMRPGLKFIAETATGHDLFKRAPLAKFSLSEALGHKGVQALAGASRTPLDNLLAIRPVREYARRVWEQPTTFRKVARAIGGGAIQAISAEQGLRALDIQTQSRIYELRRLIARAIQNRDQVEYARLQEMLREFMAIHQRRQQLRLRIPRTTEAALGRAGLTAQPQYPQVAR